MSEIKYKVALVGCGSISQNHLAALKEIPYVKVVALCDKIPERALAMRERFVPEARIYESFDELLKSEKLDAIHIATPHFLHAPMAIAALERNINVFLEKPMCISREEISALIEAEKRSSARVCVSFQNRFLDIYRLAKKYAEADGVKSAYGTVIWERNEQYYLGTDWRGRKATEGGGVLINQAIHTLDMLTFILGKPKYIWATTANHHLKEKIDVEDSAEGLIEFENGKTANFYATTSFRFADKTTLYIKTENHEIQINGNQIYVDGEKQTPDTQGFEQIGKQCYGTGHYTIVRMFYEALESGEKMPVTLEEAQWALRILLAAYESNDEKVEI